MRAEGLVRETGAITPSPRSVTPGKEATRSATPVAFYVYVIGVLVAREIGLINREPNPRHLSGRSLDRNRRASDCPYRSSRDIYSQRCPS
jgi:hypothetical protein